MTRSSIWSLTTLLCLATTAPAWGTPRVFPSDSVQVQLSAVQDPFITVDDEVVQMSQAVLIYGPTNTTVVRGALQPTILIRIQFNGQCQVRRIWILTAEEVVTMPVWTGLFSSGFVPPTCPSN